MAAGRKGTWVCGCSKRRREEKKTLVNGKLPTLRCTERMDKDVRCIDNGVLMNHKKEEKPAICNSMDGPWGHFAKWNKSGKEKYCMIALICEI